MFDLTGQTAIVTGTSRGLGQYFARALAKAGADLILTSRRRESLASFAAEIESMGQRVISLELDVRDQKSIERMAAEAEAAFGQIHILVNNAGCNVRKPALDVTWDDWNQVLETNLRGTFFVAQAIARRMVAKSYGRIINIGSVTSVFGYAGLAPYGASRGGVRQLTMSLSALSKCDRYSGSGIYPKKLTTASSLSSLTRASSRTRSSPSPINLHLQFVAPNLRTR